MYFNKDSFLYLNGEFRKAVDAKADFFGQTMHYGYGVFEGIRSYETNNGVSKIFKEIKHFQRLENSALAYNMPYLWSKHELIEASYEVLRLNNLTSAYIRPLVYAPANMGFVKNKESFIVIEAWEMEPFLGDKLVSVCISPFERPNPKGFRIEAKACGHYVNSILASQDAKAKGFDEALLMDMQGYIAEAPGANIFFEKGNALYTPSLGNILPGITRQTVIEIAEENGWQIHEGHYTKENLLKADSAFFCGTAAEIVGIHSIDKNPFPMAWDESLGSKIQKLYAKLVREDDRINQKQNKNKEVVHE